MYTAEIFTRYINQIKSPEVKNIVKRGLAECPEEFYTMAASTTGKYHPKFALGEGGLIRHTLAACCWAVDMLEMEQYEELRAYKDLILAALILHDSVKKGTSKSKYTVFEHSIFAAEMVERISKELYDETFNEVYKEKGHYIACLIASHMGQWNVNLYSKTILPKPKTATQKFVHLCDYLASRKGDVDVQY